MLFRLVIMLLGLLCVAAMLTRGDDPPAVRECDDAGVTVGADPPAR